MAAGKARDLLRDYNAKRNFAKTQEPAGASSRDRQSGQGSFVVQKHDAKRLHYDFRIELDGVLKSWAVTKGPSNNPADKRLAVRVEDHPIEYGSFKARSPKANMAAELSCFGTGARGNQSGIRIRAWNKGISSCASSGSV